MVEFETVIVHNLQNIVTSQINMSPHRNTDVEWESSYMVQQNAVGIWEVVEGKDGCWWNESHWCTNGSTRGSGLNMLEPCDTSGPTLGCRGERSAGRSTTEVVTGGLDSGGPGHGLWLSASSEARIAVDIGRRSLLQVPMIFGGCLLLEALGR